MRRAPVSRGVVLMHLACADGNRSRAAQQAGVSRQTFHSYLRKYRIQAPRPNRKLQSHDVHLIRALLADAVPVASVARKFETDRKTVLNVRDGTTFRWVW